MIQYCENCDKAYDDRDSQAEEPADFCSTACERESEADLRFCENCGLVYTEDVDTAPWDYDFCSEECEEDYLDNEAEEMEYDSEEEE